MSENTRLDLRGPEMPPLPRAQDPKALFAGGARAPSWSVSCTDHDGRHRTSAPGRQNAADAIEAQTSRRATPEAEVLVFRIRKGGAA